MSDIVTKIDFSAGGTQPGEETVDELWMRLEYGVSMIHDYPAFEPVPDDEHVYASIWNDLYDATSKVINTRLGLSSAPWEWYNAAVAVATCCSRAHFQDNDVLNYALDLHKEFSIKSADKDPDTDAHQKLLDTLIRKYRAKIDPAYANDLHPRGEVGIVKTFTPPVPES